MQLQDVASVARGLVQPQRFPLVFHDAEALFNWAIVPSILFTRRWTWLSPQISQTVGTTFRPASGEEDVVAPEETAWEIAHDEAKQISCRSAAVAVAIFGGRKTRCRLFKPRGLCEKLGSVPGL